MGSENGEDPYQLTGVDNPGSSLTTVRFDGTGFLGWSLTIKMALGAKLKLRFIDGTCKKPESTDSNYQKWIRCDYMVTCWILNSMVAELSYAFLYSQSVCELWSEIVERYGHSNGPLIYQLECDLNQVYQGNSTIVAYFNKLKKFWDELHSLNGIPACTCGKTKECSCGITEKSVEIENRSKLMQFLMQSNDDFENVRSQICLWILYPM